MGGAFAVKYTGTMVLQVRACPRLVEQNFDASQICDRFVRKSRAIKNILH